MASPESLRRLANLTKKVRDDLRKGGMGVNFRYLFRSTAILARVVELLADQVATYAEEQRDAELEARRSAEAAARGTNEVDGHPSGTSGPPPARKRAGAAES